MARLEEKARKKGKKNRKWDRNLTKCKRYRDMKTREKNKLKRVLQSNGVKAAEEYADKYELYGYLRKLLG